MLVRAGAITVGWLGGWGVGQVLNVIGWGL